MSFFKRIQATVTGSIDQAISQIENQDAIVDAILKESRQQLAKAKVRLANVERDAHAMQSETADLDGAIVNWTERARRLGESDQVKALECLRLRKAAKAKKDNLVERVNQHQVVYKRLAADVALAESRVSEMLNKQHLMRTRESAAMALKGVNSVEQNIADDLSATFDRWEMKVTESELLTGNQGYMNSVSVFESELISQEEEELLKLELAALSNNAFNEDGDRHE